MMAISSTLSTCAWQATQPSWRLGNIRSSLQHKKHSMVPRRSCSHSSDTLASYVTILDLSPEWRRGSNYRAESGGLTAYMRSRGERSAQLRPKNKDAGWGALGTFGMTSALPHQTGLPVIIYICQKNSPHSPRIKVQRRRGTKVTSGWFSMTIEDDPHVIGTPGGIRVQDIASVRQFIVLNKELLLAYWNQEEAMDTAVVLNSLKKVGAEGEAGPEHSPSDASAE